MISIDKTKGYVLMWRSVFGGPIWANKKLERVYHWVMYRANWQSSQVFPATEGINLKPGQFITSYPHAQAELGMSVGSISTYLKLLKSENIIEIKSTNKYTIVTVLNWDDLQNPERKVENILKAERKQNETDNTGNTKNTFNTSTQEAIEKIEKILGKKFTYKAGKPYYLKSGNWELIGNPVAFAASLTDEAPSATRINPILDDPEYRTYREIRQRNDDVSIRQKIALESLLNYRYPLDRFELQWKEVEANI